jgi:hypothetical protein
VGASSNLDFSTNRRSKPNFTAVENLLFGARRLKQQGESIGIMKIRFVDQMAKRPIREPIARLDDR